MDLCSDDRGQLNSNNSGLNSLESSVFLPLYQIKMNDGEQLLAKLAVVVKMPNKPDRQLSFEGLPLNNNLIRLESLVNPNKAFKPYNSQVFDGVLFITNQRFVVHFIDQFKELDFTTEVDKVELTLGNKDQIKRLSGNLRFDLEDVDNEPYLEIAGHELKLFLLDGRRGANMRRGYFEFSSFSTYKGLFDVVSYAQAKSSQSYSSIYNMIYRPISIATGFKLGYLLPLIFVCNIGLFFVQMAMRAILPDTYSGWISVISSILFFIIVAVVIILVMFVYPSQKKKFQTGLIEKE